MIFDSIILNNFGAYNGRQEAVLTPIAGKPIILFGGMNGGGKTTLLDAIQLALYGSKARISNRGKLNYKDYLRESIHRGNEPADSAGVTLQFRRMIDGEFHKFELQRTWIDSLKGVEESVCLYRDGIIDNEFTEHWDETIDAYLPSTIAHLFFFDGEQIKYMAESDHAKDILKAAIHSLLGLDLVDRLETDLKVFERRKKDENLDEETKQKVTRARDELVHIDQEYGKLVMEEGRLSNETERLAKKMRDAEELFIAEGGDLFYRRKELETELTLIKAQKANTETQYRELVSGPLPLILVEDLLTEVEVIAHHESEVRRARLLLDALEERDRHVMAALKAEKLGKQPISIISKIFNNDRCERTGLANEQLLLDADDSLAPQVAHLRATILPAATQQAKELINKIAGLDENIIQLQNELERVPTEDRIAIVKSALDEAQKKYEEKKAELDTLNIRMELLRRQREAAGARLEKMDEAEMGVRVAEDDQKRILMHSTKVRATLGRFRTKVVQRHTNTMESLMLESFCKLLRKKELIKGLTINPETFEVTLTGKDNKNLPFDRLSAGERQLLATSLLWGLARASGRLIPTVIDTPLGRLDSSHRTHLIRRYFPEASHQVLLLSTDEEIIGPYYNELKPYITRSYLLEHNEDIGQTHIKEGYFNI